MLQLTRKLVTIDVETHDNCEPEDARICEISLKVRYPDGCHNNLAWLINPGVPIAAGAQETHGIDDARVLDAPKFDDVADALLMICKECDYCGYYVRYDLRVLASEFRRCQRIWSRGNARIIDPHRLWQVAQPRRLQDAVREFLQRQPEHAHQAEDDAKNTLAVLDAQIERFSILPHDVNGLHALSFGDMVDLDGKFIWENDNVIFNFGQHGRKKTRLRDVDPNYLRWMLRQKFSYEVKQIVFNALRNVYPERETAWTASSSV